MCDKCSNYRTKLAYLGNELKRICVACSQKITGTSLVDGKPLLESHLKQVQAVQVSVRTRDTKSKPGAYENVFLIKVSCGVPQIDDFQDYDFNVSVKRYEL